ncbi:cytochrome P450 [Streptomyces sp. TRM76323]|uniref:Cytochrome P450 n=1 Tax=Streptomyces tamarix TaxID=3078565 RepID=A0ABU3QSR5_9ACTN|nr:cytochrome P450 [Streptomyces tamarix]MDT9685417.1 cytochrome P450 [Streptomyces tamarix]
MDFLAAYDAIPESDAARRVALLRQRMKGDGPALFRELRAARPVFATPVGVFVTRMPDVVEVLSTPDVFTVGVYGPTLEEALHGPFMLARDGADVHWHDRGHAQLMLPAEDFGPVRRLTARLADDALDRAVAEAHGQGRTTFDYIQEYAAPVAARVAVEYLGFTGVDERTLHRLSRRVQWAVFVNPDRDPEVHASGVAAGKELHDLVAAVIERRRAAAPGTGADGGPPKDVLDRMLRTVLPPGAEMDDERINHQLVGYLIGYQQNATQCAATALKELAARPDALAEAERLASGPDPASFDAHVWEALRFHPFVPSTPRLCVRGHVLAAGTPRETRLAAGTVVHACMASAMFDETVVEEPYAFRPDRTPVHNMVLGHGAHDCVGRYPARAIVPEMVHRVLLRPGVRPLPGADGAMDYAGTPYPQHYTVATGGAAPS